MELKGIVSAPKKPNEIGSTRPLLTLAGPVPWRGE